MADTQKTADLNKKTKAPTDAEVFAKNVSDAVDADSIQVKTALLRTLDLIKGNNAHVPNWMQKVEAAIDGDLKAWAERLAKFFANVSLYFAAHKNADKFHFTSDGQAFLYGNDAVNHGKTLAFKKIGTPEVTTVERADLIAAQAAPIEPVKDIADALGTVQGVGEIPNGNLSDPPGEIKAPAAETANPEIATATETGNTETTEDIKKTAKK
jgi:hypothetical protein